MAAIEDDPSLGEPIVPGLPYVARRGRCSRCATRWRARSSDVLSRRTRARLFGRDDSADAAEAVAALMSAELGWSAEDAAASVEEYRSAIAHERQAAGLPETHLAPLLAVDA